MEEEIDNGCVTILCSLVILMALFGGILGIRDQLSLIEQKLDVPQVETNH